MDLPNDLPARYSRITDDSDAPIPAPQLNKTVDRPGFIQWNDADDTGVSFNMRPTKAQLKADELDVATMARGGYVQMGVDSPKAVEPAPSTQMAGYYTRGIGDDAAAPVAASAASAAADVAKQEPARPHHNHLVMMLVVLALGLVAGRFASRRGWL